MSGSIGPDDGFERLLRGETPKTPEEQALGLFLQDVGGAFPAEPSLAEEAHLAAIVQAAQLLADKGEPAVRSASKADGRAPHASGLPKRRRVTMKVPLMSIARGEGHRGARRADVDVRRFGVGRSAARAGLRRRRDRRRRGPERVRRGAGDRGAGDRGPETDGPRAENETDDQGENEDADEQGENEDADDQGDDDQGENEDADDQGENEDADDQGDDDQGENEDADDQGEQD